MRIMYWGKDGGPDSTVSGFWPIELKNLFSVALLKFVGRSREAYHSHAFNSISWLLKGELIENFPDGAGRSLRPSFKPIITKRTTIHLVDSVGTSWVLTFRGPWTKFWYELINDKFILLTHGRKVVE